MSTQILIRDVPEQIHSWIAEKRRETLKSQNEFMLSVLEQAYVRERTPVYTPTLFDSQKVIRPQAPAGMLPFSFIDLFAGIGGLRMGLERAGGSSVFSCEWDTHSQKTYQKWFGEIPAGDIRKVDIDSIPDHDLLAAGFPCQPFSIAGVSKKKSLGREHGFRDKTQGTLFFHVAEIIERKKPPVVLLENVKNLLSHDKGNTWRVIKTTLEELGYTVFHQVIDAINYVPQHRERVFIVCFNKKIFGDYPDFHYPEAPAGIKPLLSDILEQEPDPKYTLSGHLWNYLQEYARKHREKGNGFGFGLCKPDSTSRTLSARYYKDGSEILIDRGERRVPRRLTPREAARLMGFSDDLPIVVSDTQAYRQFGNAVVVPVAEAVAKNINRVMSETFLLRRKGCLLKAASSR